MNDDIFVGNEDGLVNGNNESIVHCGGNIYSPNISAFALPEDGKINHSASAAAVMEDEINCAAEGGDVRAQIELACSNLKGNGKPLDHAEAFRWYREAAELGNCHAQFSVGFMYLEGLGVPRDYKQAFFWFSMAAEQGDASAQANLAWLYEHGIGVPQNDAEAIRWYRLAAINEDPYAQLSLGLMYLRGCGFPQNPSAAYVWISIAAWNGVAEAEDEQEKLEQAMTPDQISLAWQRAKACISSGYKDCADI
ncbi:tetratricopeptide repeat protein [Hoeflea sp. EC-HK425]|uniref:tetratricopeptide repeat protein n=1 Tax=Hoeflea sp. EC-HK425 TaxID=2038388 RepID=UPI001258C4D8|nr:tetratricopeptide repeat protein [Hoeflea sp. EC-HK425]VVT00568.1 putative Beta-lactamase [Hoeflea sp. EC-HK425]